jgi:CelD/BcsL family acetyltransferase involved in cellulose biosynthesis
LRLVLLKEILEDGELRRQWNQLALRVEQPQVFYTYEWALAVYRAYHQSLHPLLFLAYDEQDSLCGVAALATDASGRRVSFLCATTGDYCDFLSATDEREVFVRLVLAELSKRNIAEITLANLPADSATAAVISKAGASHRYHCFARTGYICAQVCLSALERRGDAKPVLPRKKMLRRFLNAMGREIPVRLDQARSWTEVEGLLPQFMQAHVARFLVTGRVSNMARSERRIFLTELAKLLAESGWLVLTRMMSGTKVFAWNYGFQFQGTRFWYQPTFVSELEKYSPGFCCLAKLIEESADDPQLKVVDLGLGAEEYKDRFANQTREILYVTLKSSAVQHYREIIRYHTSELVQTSPTAEAAVRAGMQRWHRAKERVSAQGVAATLFWLGKRLRELLWLKSEVFFYEWCGSPLSDSDTLRLAHLDLNQLAKATAQYVDDPATLGYLLRAASRLQEGRAQGFGLVNPEGTFLHFAWTTDFDGFFLSELNAKVDAPSADCDMLFDCWTPTAQRGHRHYPRTVQLIAKLVRANRKRPWIFSAASNRESLRGLEDAGFQPRHSLVRKRLLGWQWIEGRIPSCEEVLEVPHSSGPSQHPRSEIAS